MVEVGPTPAIRSRPTIGQRLDGFARSCLPVVLTVVLVLTASAPFGIPGQDAIRPALALICVFQWSLVRPAVMPAAAVFVIGLICDLLGWLPIGIGAVTLLGARVAAQRLRPLLAGHGLGLAWMAFGCTALAVAAVTWVLASLLSWAVLPAGPVLLAALCAVSLHPSIALLLGRIGVIPADNRPGLA